MFPLLRKEEQSGQPVSSAFEGTTERSGFDFTRLRPTKLRCIDTVRNKEEKQGWPMAATMLERSWFIAYSHLVPFPHPLRLEPGNCISSQSYLCCFVAVRCQLRPPWLTHTAVCMLGLVPPAEHWSPVPCKCPGEGDSHGKACRHTKQLLVGLDQALSSLTGLHNCTDLQLAHLALHLNMLNCGESQQVKQCTPTARPREAASEPMIVLNSC